MLDAISLFLSIAETGNFSRVAKSRNLAVSSISRKMDMLEAELGVKLFHRSSRLVVLTDAGDRFLPKARNMLAELEEAKDKFQAWQADPHGLLTVTVTSSFGPMHIAPHIGDFLKQYPRIEVELDVNDQVVDLATQRVDVAIRIGTLPASDLIATPLARMRQLVCASPDYIERHGRPTTPEELLAHNCLTVASAPVPVGWWCFAGVNRHQPLPVSGNLRSNHKDSLLQAAVDGVGIAHLPTWLISEKILSGELVSLFPDELLLAPKSLPAIHAVRMPGRSHATKAQLFIAHIKQQFGEPAYWDRALAAARSSPVKSMEVLS